MGLLAFMACLTVTAGGLYFVPFLRVRVTRLGTVVANRWHYKQRRLAWLDELAWLTRAQERLQTDAHGAAGALRGFREGTDHLEDPEETAAFERNALRRLDWLTALQQVCGANARHPDTIALALARFRAGRRAFDALPDLHAFPRDDGLPPPA